MIEPGLSASYLIRFVIGTRNRMDIRLDKAPRVPKRLDWHSPQALIRPGVRILPGLRGLESYDFGSGALGDEGYKRVEKMGARRPSVAA